MLTKYLSAIFVEKFFKVGILVMEALRYVLKEGTG